MSYQAFFEKVYNGHLESRRPDSVWVERVPNTFSFCNCHQPKLQGCFLDFTFFFFIKKKLLQSDILHLSWN